MTKNHPRWIIAILLLCFFSRFLLIPSAKHGDLNNNASWGSLLLQRGTFNFYESTPWPYSSPNQPPVYVMVFGFVMFVYNVITRIVYFLNTSVTFFPSHFVWFWEIYGELYCLKFPGILADVGIAFLIYSYWKNKGKRQMGLILSVVWSLLPISFYSSSIWGQTDSLVNLLGLIGIYFLLKRKLHYFSVFFTLSFLYKPSLAVFIPVLLLYIYKQHYSLKHFLQSTMLSLSLIIFFSFLFHPQLDSLFWLIRLYLEKILPGEVGYLTANAFNFWWLINPGRVLDSTILYLVPARILGYFLTFIFLLPVLLRLLRSKSPRPEILLVALFLSSFTFFVFMTRIHERYLYPVFPILTLLLGYLPKLWVLYITLGVIHLFNLYYLFWAPSLPVLETFQKNTPFMNVLFSFATVLLFFVFYLYFLFFNRFFKFHMRADLAHLDV